MKYELADCEPRPSAPVEDLSEAASAIRSVASRRPQLRKVAVFGSFARGEQARGSDVDLLVLTEDDATTRDKREIGREMSSALGRDVDLITSLSGCPRYFIDSIRRDGVIVYER